MKKALLSALLLAGLVGQVNIADAQGEVKPCYTASKVQVKSPNMLERKTINAIKSGQYSFGGIKLDMSYPGIRQTKDGNDTAEPICEDCYFEIQSIDTFFIL
ncbi:hypothetical protein BFS35_012670 [Macrococcoides goetzii]|uniref:Uncharacterized protein n=1 Tax=Macrococcoides goetzii TaxID=1891097 RepID=A0A2G5NUF2_9STAP|nr:hypothetical protein [Macrococcus goetzii]RAI79064.1 hypothetical protein BFS35_012670 [Macrococcus goetzii]